MEEIEVSARTVDDAIEEALEQLGVDREDVEITVLSEGKTGILGLGAQDARVRVRALRSGVNEAPEQQIETTEIAELAKTVIESLLEELGFKEVAVSQVKPFAGGTEEEISPITFDITTEDSGILIGRRGQTLASLQYIINLILTHKVKAWVPVAIDIEGYKQRHYDALIAMAARIADQVRTRKRPFTLEPMPPYERRIIHLALAKHPDVTTQSIDEGENRKVMVLPRD